MKLQPKHESEEWDLVSYCDSDWAGDPESRISVTVFIIHFLGVPICWRSKAQKGVTLSSSEAEYVAMSEAVKEIRFIFYLLTSMLIEVKFPIIVRCDNVGAIFMAENLSSGVYTKHADISIISFMNMLWMISSRSSLLSDVIMMSISLQKM